MALIISITCWSLKPALRSAATSASGSVPVVVSHQGLREFHQRIKLRLFRILPAAQGMDLLAAEAGFFRHQGVRGQAVVTAGGFADRQINRLQLLGAEAAFMEHRIVRQRLLRAPPASGRRW